MRRHVQEQQSIEDTYATKPIIQNIVGQAQIKQVMAETNTHEIYVESYHGWFSIINSYSFMLAIKHNSLQRIMTD